MASRPEPLRAFRIADARHPIFDGTGAMLWGARWNSPGRRVIYAAETYAGALLEVLVHASGRIPRAHRYVEIAIPSVLKVEVVSAKDIRRWDADDFIASRAFGDRWYDERRTPVLIVPSVVTRVESNVLINQAHPAFRRIRCSQPKPVRWDARLFR
jgi:RES domain-containing protein